MTWVGQVPREGIGQVVLGRASACPETIIHVDRIFEPDNIQSGANPAL